MHAPMRISLAPSLGTQPRPSSREAWLPASALLLFCYVILGDLPFLPARLLFLGHIPAPEGSRGLSSLLVEAPTSVDTVGSPGDLSRHSDASGAVSSSSPVPHGLRGALLPAHGVGGAAFIRISIVSCYNREALASHWREGFFLTHTKSHLGVFIF